MSEAGARPERSRSTEFLVIGLIVVAVIGVFLYINGQRQTTLRASAVGMDGLEIWLVSNDIAAQNFFGGWQINRERVDLAILPLFDTDLTSPRERPQTQEELLLQQDEVDAFLSVVTDKADDVPLLIVLPKWRSGMRLTRLGHPVLLSERDRIETVFRRITGERNARVTYGAEAFTRVPYAMAGNAPLNAELYAAQLIAGANCLPIIGTKEAMLLGECPVNGAGDSVLVLSDPDLLNNHGLRLGDNARIVEDFVENLHDDGIVLIDYSQNSWFTAGREAIAREREWSDLRRFFEPPFATIWAAAAVCLALALWRGGVRGRPALQSAMAGLRASKTLAIRARARLMRLSDQEGAMLGAYASARIAATATRLLGPAHGLSYSSDKAFQAYVARRHPAHAERLKTVLGDLRALPARVTASDAAAHVRHLEAVLEDISHDT